ncbi:MAG: hypothetical protein LBS06_03250 [Treponema sp.]|jgi:site-specific DNA-methyltransferase (cytosine-N4-specific)|nr:hypothetical protein [Treponema sp.]
MNSEYYSTAEVANLAGIHKDTLLRWLRCGIVKEPNRDRHGWRFFLQSEADEVIKLAKIPVPCPHFPEKSINNRKPGLFKLSSINWDFENAKTSYLTHGIHPYPAKFIPQIPNTLIQELSGVGDTVGDIFCGSGTTLVESIILKRHAVGIDANPLACLISKVKTTLISDDDVQDILSLSQRARQFYVQLTNNYRKEPFKKYISSAWRPSFAKLTFWFDLHIIEELAEILSWCRKIKNEAAKNIALTAFSSIIVAVSKQDSDTRYVRRDKNILPGETTQRFCRALNQVTKSVMEFTKLAEPNFNCTIVEGNLLASPIIPKLDLVVCSPPYPNAYSYHLYHMTRMIWLEMDQQKFKHEEIGSHRKYSSGGKNGATSETFRREFGKIFMWLKQYLRKDGYACFVIGNSTIKGEIVDNANLLHESSCESGFREVMRINRNMQPTKKYFNPSIGKIKNENIVIFERTGKD